MERREEEESSGNCGVGEGGSLERGRRDGACGGDCGEREDGGGGVGEGARVGERGSGGVWGGENEETLLNRYRYIDMYTRANKDAFLCVYLHNEEPLPSRYVENFCLPTYAENNSYYTTCDILLCYIVVLLSALSRNIR